MNTLYQFALSTLKQQVSSVVLPVHGEIPSWLSGCLFRNGPAQFEVAHQVVNHWFDGFAMVHRFAIHSNVISYSNRFLASQAYLKAQQEQKLVYEEFATKPDYGPLKRLGRIFSLGLTDNANVNIMQAAGQYMALTETTRPLVFDSESLETQGYFHFDDTIKGHLSTAHPLYDAAHSVFYNINIQLGLRSYYHVYALPALTRQRKLLCAIPVRHPSYMHSFAMTERFLILIESPLRFYLSKLCCKQATFIESYEWQPQESSRFWLIEKATGRYTSVDAQSAFFNFHVINAYEEADTVVIDLPIFKDAAIIKQLYLSEFRQQAPDAAQAYRFRIRLTDHKVQQQLLSDVKIELPTIHARSVTGKGYRYFYAPCENATGDFLNSLVKYDLLSGSSLFWREQGCYPGEAVFVANPTGSAEDDGVLLSVLFDVRAEKSFLLILDARSLIELARAELPHIVPFGFHGQFFDSTTAFKL